MSEPKILTQLKDRVLTITLNRPEALNSIDLQLAIELCVSQKSRTIQKLVPSSSLAQEIKPLCCGDLLLFRNTH